MNARNQRLFSARQALLAVACLVLAPIAALAHEGTDGQYIIKAVPGNTGVRMAVIEQATEPGVGPPWHLHTREDEVFYIIEGTIQFWRGTETFVRTAGAVEVLPRGIPHTFKNVGKTRARVLFTLLPDGLEKFFELRNQYALSPAEIDALAKTYGLTYFGPAPAPNKAP